jgi:predicted AAA+ superfamily ATPase
MFDWASCKAALWRARSQSLKAVTQLDAVTLDDLTGIDRQKRMLVENTEQHLRGEGGNHVLLWGSRGTGKSTLMRALINAYGDQGLRVLQIEKEDLADLPYLVDDLRELPYRFVVFCDDLSFEEGEYQYKALKTVIDGSIELPPENVRVYATSNRRHLVTEKQSDNSPTAVTEREIHYGDVVEEKLSLADRFGLWLSFYPISIQQYLDVIQFKLGRELTTVETRQATLYARNRASHSARTAQQFIKQMTDND